MRRVQVTAYDRSYFVAQLEKAGRLEYHVDGMHLKAETNAMVFGDLAVLFPIGDELLVLDTRLWRSEGSFLTGCCLPGRYHCDLGPAPRLSGATSKTYLQICRIPSVRDHVKGVFRFRQVKPRGRVIQGHPASSISPYSCPPAPGYSKPVRSVVCRECRVAFRGTIGLDEAQVLADSEENQTWAKRSLTRIRGSIGVAAR